MKYKEEIRQGTIDFFIGIYDGLKTMILMMGIICGCIYALASFPLVFVFIWSEDGPWGWLIPGMLAWIAFGIYLTVSHGRGVRQDGNIHRWLP